MVARFLKNYYGQSSRLLHVSIIFLHVYSIHQIHFLLVYISQLFFFIAINSSMTYVIHSNHAKQSIQNYYISKFSNKRQRYFSERGLNHSLQHFISTQ